MPIPSENDIITDSNNDGISDYYTWIMCEGILLHNGEKVFGDASYSQVMRNNDFDVDGLKNGDEVKVKRNANGYFVEFHSSPILKDTDGDGIEDKVDISPEYKDNFSNYFIKYINKKIIDMSSVQVTDDGFIMSTVSIGDILKRLGNGSQPANYESLKSWYLFAVKGMENYNYGILRMKTGVEYPVVSVSFAGLDMKLIDDWSENKNVEKLNEHLEKMRDGSKIIINSHNETIVNYFSHSFSKASYLIADEYIKLVVQEECDNNKFKIPNLDPKENKELKEVLDKKLEELKPDIYTGEDYIQITDINNLTLKEKQAIMVIRTGNPSLNSFAAEIVFHAVEAIGAADRYTSNQALIDMINKSVFITDEMWQQYEMAITDQTIQKMIYKSAVIADCGIKDTYSLIREVVYDFEKQFYSDDSKYVKEQQKYFPKM